MSTAPPAPAARPDVRAWRLLATLGTGGALAGLLIVVVFAWTRPTIEANKARALDAALQEVLKGPHGYETLYIVNGALTPRVPAGVDARSLDRIYRGYGTDQRPIGYAIPARENGFQDVIGLIFGYDPATKQILGMTVLETKETPGLGDKIERDDFRAQFDGAVPPLIGVKARGTDGKNRQHIQTVTGATISSRTVLRAINKAMERVGPMIETYRPEARE